MKLSQLARKLQGELQGPGGETEVSGISTLQDARADQVCYFGNSRYRKYLKSTQALAVITGEPIATSAPNQILVSQPYRAFRQALLLFRTASVSRFRGVHETATVHSSAHIHDDVTLAPGVVVDAGASIGAGTAIGSNSYIGPGATVGSDCLLASNVNIYHDCQIGHRVIVHSGAVIGADGFGFVPDPAGHLKVPQNGNVIVGSDVEIGAGTTIDRAVVGSTMIGNYTKLDNLVHIAHNVTLGAGCLVAAQTGIAGSTTVGSGVVFGGQAGIGGHLNIGDRAVIAAQAGVMKDVPAGVTVSGYPAREHSRSLRVNASLMGLPEFREEVVKFMRSIEEENE